MLAFKIIVLAATIATSCFRCLLMQVKRENSVNLLLPPQQ